MTRDDNPLTSGEADRLSNPAEEIDVEYGCGECGRRFSVRQTRRESKQLLAVIHCPVCVSPDNVVPLPSE
jgi:DNA-directed RNA polymerase subunit RPC12/RpoP